jgi:hypothetical protein
MTISDNGKKDPSELNLKEMRDMTIGDVKALFPEMQQGPLFSPNLDSGNPGVRLIANDDKLIDMLKIVYVEDYAMADNIADALGECDEFLLDPDGKPNAEVLQRVEWIKYKLAIYCSVKGRFADAYKQTATGILTNAMSEKGWNPLQMPLGKNKYDREDQNQNKGNRP